MFQLVNTKTKKVAFIGKTPSECKAYAIKNKLFSVQRGGFLKYHIIWGDWDIQKV